MREFSAAIRKVCEASGISLTIEIPGLGRAIVVRENGQGHLIGLFKNADLAATLDRGISDELVGRGSVRSSGIAPEDQRAPGQPTVR